MSDFYKRFLMEEGRRLNSETGRYVALAAFGKHPGWDDHIEDLGLETDSLILARKVLYVQGVGGQIDTGAWEKLKEEHRIAVFNHTFVWVRGDQLLLGRMWSSSDGKGRTRYPMIVCAHCVGAPLTWALEKVLPRLVEVENACQNTKSAGDVRAILSQARNVLRNSIRDPETESARKSPNPTALDQFVSAPAFGPAREGWFRILYWLQSQAATFGPGKFNLKGDLSSLRAQQIRVPSGSASPTEVASLWTRFFSLQVDRNVPALFVWPAEGNWLDVTLGEPTSHEFFCLRASREAVPFATEIPYDFDQKFRDQAAQWLNDFQAGRPQRGATPQAEKEKPATDSPSATTRFFKSLGGKFFIVALLLIGIAAAAVFFLKPGFGSGETQPGEKQSGQPQELVSTPPKPIATPVKLREDPNTEKPPAPARPEISPPPVSPAPVAQAETPRRDPIAPAPAPPPKTQPVAEAKPATEPKVTNPEPGPTTPAPGTTVAANTVNEKPASDPIVPAGSRELVVTNGIGMVLLWISGLPGSREGGWVGKWEVRQAEYQKVFGSNPSKLVDPEQPVENLSWQEATEFCRKLSADEQASGRLPASFVYALPTQQQWDFFLGSASFENAITSRDQPSLRTAPARVGTLPPNQFGLCDVLGNVWEWCADSDSPEQKVSKGGAFNNTKVFGFKPLERTSLRRSASDARSVETGFRCVLVQR